MLQALRFILIGSALLSPIAAQAYDLPKSGKAEYDTYYVSENLHKMEIKMESGDANSGIANFTGITRNIKGPGPFNDMSVQCLMHRSIIRGTWSNSGSCVETDRTGDSVFTTFDPNYHYIVGGTGKYKGISGKARYQADGIHRTVSGKDAWIVRHNINWEIK